MTLPTLFLALDIGSGALIGIILLAVVIGAGAGIAVLSLMTGATLRRAREESRNLTSAAEREAETIRQRAEIEADKKAIERREAVDHEIAQAREKLDEAERRVAKREDNLDRKLDTLGIKEKRLEDLASQLDSRQAQIEKKQEEVSETLRKQMDQLMHIASMSKEEARETLLKRIEDECREEVQGIIQRMSMEAEDEAKTNAREMIIMAIQRYAAETTAESTVRSIAIPSDDMKGRIIGREGRNIRAIERATGVDVMVDDTPGVISVSCFDKVRQAIAAESLSRLVEDGRVHPTRIEEVVETVRKEIEERIVRFGKEAATEAKIRGLHPKISEAMGRLHYRTSFGQNILRHSIEVAYLSQIIADQLGLDGDLARRCGFLHDIGKAMDHELEGGHPKIGMEFCKKYNEREEVLNAIGGHHGDIPSISPYTPIVMAADAVSGARPGARRESMEQYIQRLEQLEAIAKEHGGVTEAYAIQAGREVRVIVDANSVSDPNAFSIARDIAKKVSEEMTFPGEIKVTVLRETRAIEYAT